jgi:hypothetical protein
MSGVAFAFSLSALEWPLRTILIGAIVKSPLTSNAINLCFF